MTIWRFIDSGACDAAYNMGLDEAISVSVRNGDSPPTLRLYGWEAPSVSIGSFQKFLDINMQYCAGANIPVVRRPTGGRGILHTDELTYSFSSKNEGFFSKGLLGSYSQISTAFMFALEMIGLHVAMKIERESGRNLMRSPLCFQSTSFGEISYNGRKLIGSAQKRWNDGFLQQGSIPYTIDYEKTAAVFNSKRQGAECKGQKAMMTGIKELLSDFNPVKFKLHIKTSFERTFDVRLIESDPSSQEKTLARSLAFEKYQSLQWTEGAGEKKKNRFYNNNEKLRTA